MEGTVLFVVGLALTFLRGSPAGPVSPIEQKNIVNATVPVSNTQDSVGQKSNDDSSFAEELVLRATEAKLGLLELKFAQRLRDLEDKINVSHSDKRESDHVSKPWGDEIVHLDLDTVINQMLITLYSAKTERDLLELKLEKVVQKYDLVLESQQTELISLEEKLESRNSEIISLEEKLESQNTEIISLQGKLESQNTEMTSLEEKLESEKTLRHSLGARLVQAEQKILKATDKIPPQTKCESGEICSQYCKLGVNSMAECFNKDHPVTYRSTFTATPAVSFGLRHIDKYHKENTRLSVTVTNQTPDGMSVKFSTWDKSWTYRACVSWMACGQV